MTNERLRRNLSVNISYYVFRHESPAARGICCYGERSVGERCTCITTKDRRATTIRIAPLAARGSGARARVVAMFIASNAIAISAGMKREHSPEIARAYVRD